MIKSKKGFTLVELIVVIAILGILAGVGVVAYNGYIEKAQDAAVITELDAIKTAAQAANATAGEIEKIEVADKDTVKVYFVETSEEDAEKNFAVAPKFGADFKMFYNGKAADITDEGVIEITLETAISNWENSSYNKDPDTTSADKDKIGPGATWLAAKDDTSKFIAGWNNGIYTK